MHEVALERQTGSVAEELQETIRDAADRGNYEVDVIVNDDFSDVNFNGDDMETLEKLGFRVDCEPIYYPVDSLRYVISWR